MAAIIADFIVGNFLTGRFGNSFALGTMMVLGRCVALIGVIFGMILLASGLVHPVVLFGSVVFIGLGNGLTLPASNAGAFSV